MLLSWSTVTNPAHTEIMSSISGRFSSSSADCVILECSAPIDDVRGIGVPAARATIWMGSTFPPKPCCVLSSDVYAIFSVTRRPTIRYRGWKTPNSHLSRSAMTSFSRKTLSRTSASLWTLHRCTLRLLNEYFLDVKSSFDIPIRSEKKILVVPP